MIVWWGTETECLSALVRQEREGGLDRRAMSLAEESLSKILGSAHEVQPNTELRRIARRLLMSHSLHAADAFQLSAALLVGGSLITELPFITLDKNLSFASAKEGFWRWGSRSVDCRKAARRARHRGLCKSTLPQAGPEGFAGRENREPNRREDR